MQPRYNTLLFILVILALMLTGCKQSAKVAPKATNGTLDLTNWDFKKDGSVRLDGQWEFFWQHLLEPRDFGRNSLPPKNLIEVPGPWNGVQVNGKTLDGYGYATFYLRILLPKDNQSKALRLSSLYTAHRVWVNGELLSADGIVATSKEASEPKHYHKNLYLDSGLNRVDLVIQVSNFMHRRGGIWQPLLLGNSEDIQHLRERQLATDMILFGTFFCMGMYHLYIFFLRRHIKTALFFGLFCLLVALRVLLVGQIIVLCFFPHLSQELLLKLEYWDLCLGLSAFSFFIHSLYPFDVWKTGCYITLGISSLYCLLVLLTPASIYSHLLPAYEWVIFFTLIYLLIALAQSFIRKRPDAKTNLFGTGVFVAASVNDLFYFADKPSATNLIPFGVFVMVFTQSLILSRRFASAFATIERMSSRLISINKLKDDFLATISHELLTPLNGIIGIAESIQDGASGELKPQQRHNLSLIISSGRRLSRLIDDLQDFSKLKHKDIILFTSPISLKQVVEIVLTLSRPLIGDKALRLVNNIPHQLPLVEADENRLQQVLHNLIANAIKYTPSGEITVSACQKDMLVEVAVRDTGIGIPREMHQHIFNSFEQGIPGKASDRGIGLGLFISKTLVELHGGSIWVVSEPGQGSTFFFTLPLNSAKTNAATEVAVAANPYLSEKLPQAKEVAKPAPIIGSGSKILVVDDEAINLQVLVNQLSLEKYSVLLATSGQEALEIIGRERDLDLVILDIMLPDLSGYDICRLIREKHSLLELPILMITAKTRTEDTLHAFALGANDYLPKPFNKEVMLARVRTLLTLRQVMKDMVTAQLQFLQAQIKPHFIYNALNTIMVLCRTNPEKAADLLDELSNYLRGKFRFNSTDGLIPLEKELDFVKSYLTIEQARFGERLRLRFDIDPGVNPQIPALSLQPLVENAVRHGIYPQKQGGTVEISVQQQADSVFIVVRDDGLGIPPEKMPFLLTGQAKEAGIGLLNVHRRLKRYYGGTGLQINSQVDLGTEVTIIIPSAKGVDQHDQSGVN